MPIEFYSIIYTIPLQLPFVLSFYFLYRDWLRFSVPVTIITISLLYGFESFAFVTSLFDSARPMVIIDVCVMLVSIILIRREHISDILIIDKLLEFVLNVGGTALMAALSFTYSVMSGQTSEIWYNPDPVSVTDMMMKAICAAIAVTFGLIICKKCIPVLKGVRSSLKLMLCMGFVLPIYLFIAFSRFFITDQQQYLDGFVVIIYGILLIVTTVSLLIFFINIFMQAKEDNRLIQTRIESQNMHYRRVLKAQQELREAKHDLVNTLAAYNISQTHHDKQQTEGELQLCQQQQ